MELSAELIDRDGSSRPFRVNCERTLRGVLGGLERLQGEVSMELTQLVEREKGAGAAQSPDIEEEEEEDDDDDNSKNGTLSRSPPPKKIKTRQH